MTTTTPDPQGERPTLSEQIHAIEALRNCWLPQGNATIDAILHTLRDHDAVVRERDSALADNAQLRGDYELLDARYRGTIEALRARVAEAERLATIYAAERDREAKRAELMLNELVAITAAVLPDKISVDGVTYEYVPPDPHVHLKLLSVAIKAVRERVAAERAPAIDTAMAEGGGG